MLGSIYIMMYVGTEVCIYGWLRLWSVIWEVEDGGREKGEGVRGYFSLLVG